ncbi:MAG TPA: HAD family hydrolase [Bacilli bacterium]|nr:HAD family hydrolase [Bacilli bacterium]
MVKRLIFDLDNTLILLKDKYRDGIKKTVEYYKLDINYIDVDDVIEDYENHYNFYSKENMLKLINDKFNLNLGIDFIDMWLSELGNMGDYDKNVEETLKYLSNKYELVVLTNWFKDSQLDRLKHAKIDKYFKKVIGGDKYIKPNIEAYKEAMDNLEIEECIMIGDNYKVDLETPINIGMKVIQVDLKDKIKEEKEYQVIKKISELQDIL